MEKIQSAIAKARAERRKQAPPEPKPRNKSVASDSDHEAWNQLPLIEPDMRRLRAQRIVTLDRSYEAGAFDKLRTRMLQQMQANDWSRVAITSPGPAGGKSTIALNLAFSLSRQMRTRVILLEMDLRNPSLNKFLRLKTERNFAEVIRENATFGDEAVRLRPNLAVGMLRNPVLHAAEMLHNPQLSETLNDIERTYAPTVMLFDMPPFQTNDDMMAFADKVDCALIVAAAEQTKIEELDLCERELASATNVLGVVLNKCRYDTVDGNYGY